VAQSLAKAALASVAANNILIVSSYGSGQRRSTLLASLYASRESGCKRNWSTG
jgi:hypothetical protein